MSGLSNFKFAGLACVVGLSSLMFGNSWNVARSTDDEDVALRKQVAALEMTVESLQRQIENDKLTSSLVGHYWVEQSRVLAGEQEEQHDEIAWRLAANASSDRYILAPEVSTDQYGPFSVDSSHEPAWIDFQVRRFGKTHNVKGIVRTSFGRCEIAIPGELFDDGDFLDPPRPTSFDSTASNGYDVYRLVRKRYKQTGVWQ